VFDEDPIRNSFTDTLTYNNGIENKSILIPKGYISSIAEA